MFRGSKVGVRLYVTPAFVRHAILTPLNGCKMMHVTLEVYLFFVFGLKSLILSVENKEILDFFHFL